jgi:curved DNA-binding protein CbpA
LAARARAAPQAGDIDVLVHYLTLGLVPGASDAQIRQRYLELTRQHPPGRDPQRFRSIAAAYQALATERGRMDATLFGMGQIHDPRAALHELIEAAAQQRRSPGLQDLIRAEGISHG